jgi:hypothetical protein
VDLVRDVADVASEKGLERTEVTFIAPQPLEVRTDPRRPVRLQDHTPPGARVIEHLEQQIPVAISGVVLESLLVHAIGLDAHLVHLGGGQETANDAEALPVRSSSSRHKVARRANCTP